MAGLNPRLRRWDKRGVVQHHGTPRLKVVPEMLLQKPVQAPDPVELIRARVGDAVFTAAVEVAGPILAERDQRIADLYEELRLARIRADQADRLHARVDRARERRIEELQQEVERANGHAEYLRGELAKSREVDHLADAIVSAMPESEPGRRLRQEAPPPPPTPAPVVDLGGLAQAIVEAQKPMFTELATALKPTPPSEVEIVRDDMGNVKGARRKKPEDRQSSLPIDQWPVPK